MHKDLFFVTSLSRLYFDIMELQPIQIETLNIFFNQNVKSAATIYHILLCSIYDIPRSFLLSIVWQENNFSLLLLIVKYAGTTTLIRQKCQHSYFIFTLKWIAPYYKLSMDDSSFVFVLLLTYQGYHESSLVLWLRVYNS